MFWLRGLSSLRVASVMGQDKQAIILSAGIFGLQRRAENQISNAGEEGGVCYIPSIRLNQQRVIHGIPQGICANAVGGGSANCGGSLIAFNCPVLEEIANWALIDIGDYYARGDLV